MSAVRLLAWGAIIGALGVSALWVYSENCEHCRAAREARRANERAALEKVRGLLRRQQAAPPAADASASAE